MVEIILASKSKVRKEILDRNNIINIVDPSNVDEDIIKDSLIKENASPTIISKNLAELKANKVSQKNPGKIVLGADSVIDLDGKLISKPINRVEALNILKELNGKKHYLVRVIIKFVNCNKVSTYIDFFRYVVKLKANLLLNSTCVHSAYRGEKTFNRKSNSKICLLQ